MAEIEATVHLDTREAERKLKELVERTRQAIREIKLEAELESNRAAFEFGKSVQRVEDRQAAEQARGSILMGPHVLRVFRLSGGADRGGNPDLLETWAEGVVMGARRKQETVQQRYMRRLRERLMGLLGGRCVVCGALTPLEFAHLEPTPILRFNRGRGSKHRLLDVKRNLRSYALLCAPCHDAFDGRTDGRTEEMTARGWL